MGFDLCVLWQVVSLINLKMKRMFNCWPLRSGISGAIPRRSSLHAIVCSFSHVFFPFLSLPEWTNAMSAAILFRAND